MTVIAQSVHTLSNVVKHEYGADFAYCRELVTVNDDAGTLAVGTILGAVTASGKFVRAKETATDGSKAAAAIVWEAKTIPGSTDVQVLALVRGPAGVSKAGLVVDATYDNAAKKNAVYAALEANGIQVLETV